MRYKISQAALQRAENDFQEMKKTERRSGSTRQIVSATYADENNLNHGRVWTCNERNIEAQGVSPELEGALICYIYSD